MKIVPYVAILAIMCLSASALHTDEEHLAGTIKQKHRSIEDMAKTTYYLTGNAADVASSLTLGGPFLDLGGGSTDVDAAFQQTIDTIRGCTGSCTTKIDIVILRASGSNGYNAYLYAMNGVDSVQTYVLTKKADANALAVETAIKNAEFIFYAGGDQCNYVTNFKGTKVETATEFAYARGAAVGGTSAGMAILGGYINDGCGSSQGVTSSTALANPYHSSITFTYAFYNFGFMNQVLTDQHFVPRDRMGRLLVFLARQIKDNKTTVAWGVASNEETSIIVNKNGLATVIGNDGLTQYGAGNPVPPESENPVAYFILADHSPQVCQAGTPLTYLGYKVWKRNYGETFNLANRPTTGEDYILNVNAGVITDSGNGGEIY